MRKIIGCDSNALADLEKKAMRLVCDLIAIFLLMVIVSQVQASQEDERLNTLFVQLKSASNTAEARMVETEIQTIWMESGQEDKDINILMYKGVLAIKLNKLSTALMIFDLVTTKVPNFAEAWNKRAFTYFLMGNYDDSIKDLQKTLSLEPRHFSALSGLAFIYKKQGQYDEALEGFTKISKIYPHFQELEIHVASMKKAVSLSRI